MVLLETSEPVLDCMPSLLRLEISAELPVTLEVLDVEDTDDRLPVALVLAM